MYPTLRTHANVDDYILLIFNIYFKCIHFILEKCHWFIHSCEADLHEYLESNECMYKQFIRFLLLFITHAYTLILFYFIQSVYMFIYSKMNILNLL